MNTLKRKIAENFSRFAESYDLHAQLQEKSARTLLSFLEQQYQKIPEGPVLEIGCGSGRLSAYVLPHLSDRRITLNDISSGMVQVCRERLQEEGTVNHNIQFKVFDAEKIDETDMYALIYSGLTFQWFEDFFKTLEILFNALKQQGSFVCSFLTNDSFDEWRRRALAFGLHDTVNRLPQKDEVLRFLQKKGWQAEHAVHKVRLQYPSVLDFFRSLKKTGVALNVRGVHNDPARLRRFISSWEREQTGTLEICCSVCYLVVQK